MMIGLGLGVSFGRGGGFNPRSLWPLGTEAGMWLDPSDAATVYQDSAGTTPGALNSPVGARVDKRLGSATIAGAGNHVLQATAAARPTWKLNGAIYSDLGDGVDDGYGNASLTLINGMDCFIAIKRNSAAKGILASTAATTAIIGCFESGSGVAATSNAGTPTYLVNGVAVPGGAATTRAQLDTALPSGGWLVLEARDLDLSAWSNFQFSLFPGYAVAADIGGLILCPAQSAGVRSQIRTYLGAKVGLSL